MMKYKVKIIETVTKIAEVIIEADSEQQAFNKGHEEIEIENLSADEVTESYEKNVYTYEVK